MAADVAGGLVIAGDVTATTDLSGPPLVAPACSTVDLSDVFLSRFDNSGYFLWQRRFGDCETQNATALALDGTDIVLGGTFYSTIDFGLGPTTSIGEQDWFVARFDAGGAPVWSKGFASSTSRDARSGLRALAVDASSDVFVAGATDDAIDLGGGPLTATSDLDVVVAKLDANGSHLWSERFGDSGTHDLSSIASDRSGGVVVAGVSSGSIEFGGGSLSGSGVYVADLAGDGAHRWSAIFVSSNARVGRVRVDASRAVLVAGTFEATLDLHDRVLGGASHGVSGFAMKLDAAGAVVWARAFIPSFGSASAVDLVVDPRDESIVLGDFTGGLDGLTDLGGGDLFVEKLAR